MQIFSNSNMFIDNLEQLTATLYPSDSFLYPAGDSTLVGLPESASEFSDENELSSGLIAPVGEVSLGR